MSNFDADAVLEVLGGGPLRGAVAVQGSPRAASQLLCAALLTSESCSVANVPETPELDGVLGMLGGIGATVSREGDRVDLRAGALAGDVPTPLSPLNRTPLLLLGPLLARNGSAAISLTSPNPAFQPAVADHVDALRALGAEVELEGAILTGRAGRLVGCRHRLPCPSVGVTATLLLTAVVAEGTTVIENAAVDPEIADLSLLLQRMGARVVLQTERRIVVEGGANALHGAEHTVLPDHREARFYAWAAAATGGAVDVHGIRQAPLMGFLNDYRRAGGDLEVSEDAISFRRAEQTLRRGQVESGPFPATTADGVLPAVVALTQAVGSSTVHETVDPRWLAEVDQLRQMGARIDVTDLCLGSAPCPFAGMAIDHSAVVEGAGPLLAADLAIPSTSAGFGLLLAALLADGRTRLGQAWHLERSYAHLPAKLGLLGATVRSYTAA